jgi:hypothetical protein
MTEYLIRAVDKVGGRNRVSGTFTQGILQRRDRSCNRTKMTGYRLHPMATHLGNVLSEVPIPSARSDYVGAGVRPPITRRAASPFKQMVRHPVDPACWST